MEIFWIIYFSLLKPALLLGALTCPAAYSFVQVKDALQVKEVNRVWFHLWTITLCVAAAIRGLAV